MSDSGTDRTPARASGGRTSFIIAVAVLGLAAVGLNAATNALRLYFKKEPVALALPLTEVPAQLGPWRQFGPDRPLPSDIEHTLGTEEYIFRVYYDTRVIRPEWMDEISKGLEDQDENARRDAGRRQGELFAKYPGAFVNMAVTYYTGMVDTVAHIPDRCYVAGGFEPTESPQEVAWDVRPHAPVTVRYIKFQDQTDRQPDRNVAYFFQVNGAYECDPIRGVRIRLQDLRERHGYYAKIELMNQVKDESAAKAAMADYLAAALPDIERCLPDWKKVKAGESSPTTPAIPAAATQGTN